MPGRAWKMQRKALKNGFYLNFKGKSAKHKVKSLEFLISLRSQFLKLTINDDTFSAKINHNGWNLKR